MEAIFKSFSEAYNVGGGYELSMTLSPVAPEAQPDRLSRFFNSTNASQAQRDFRRNILHNDTLPFKLPTEEGNAWVEVYYMYWKAVGEILSAEADSKTGKKVR
jgi:hypothetical protein